MKKDNEYEAMLVELAADDDVRQVLDDLALSFDEALRSEGMKKSKAARLAGMDPSVLSRLINGRNPNPSLLTVAKIYRALGRRLELGSTLLQSIPSTRGNWCRSVDYDAARQLVNIHSPQRQVETDAEKWHSARVQDTKPSFRIEVSKPKSVKEVSAH